MTSETADSGGHVWTPSLRVGRADSEDPRSRSLYFIVCCSLLGSPVMDPGAVSLYWVPLKNRWRELLDARRSESRSGPEAA